MWPSIKAIVFGIREICVQRPTPPPVSPMIFPMFVKNFKPKFTNLQNGANNTYLGELSLSPTGCPALPVNLNQ